MQFSLNWLQDYFKQPLSAKSLKDSLTRVGIEVDATSELSPPIEGVIVAEVKKVTTHPNADKLCIAEVFTGTETKQVVCGASNCKEGLLCAFAPIGARLKDSNGKWHTLKKGVLRGIDSFGMLLSAEELGLEEKSEGIIELSNDYKIGDLLENHFKDTLLEISFTPDLGHAMSHLGLAREIAAITGFKKNSFSPSPLKTNSFSLKDLLSIEIDSPEDCSAFGCVLIKDVKIAPSPLWLRLRLSACGIKSINNVVDATNYILYELGQPLHAYDYEKIEGNKISIHTVEKESSLTTLDQKQVLIPKGTLVVADAKKTLCIAGIMGLENSQVSSKTNHILLEAAHFNPSKVRRSSKKLGISTESSKHFERSVDPALFQEALLKAAELIAQLTHGSVSSDLLKKETPIVLKTIQMRLHKLNNLLGISLQPEEVQDILNRLHFKFQFKADCYLVTIPSFRTDLLIEEDLIDEVARFYGLDRITKKTLLYSPTAQQDSPHYLIEKKLHTLLRAEGLKEVITADLISPEMNEIHENFHLQIPTLNYMSKEQSVLRTSLLANHLSTLKHNQDHQNPNLQLYELGSKYEMRGECFEEIPALQITLTGRNTPYHWEQKEDPIDFFHLKGILQNIFSALKIFNITFEKASLKPYHPNVCTQIFSEKTLLGIFGQLHPSVLRKAGLKQKVFSAELSTTALIKLSKNEVTYNPISPFPSSERDWTFKALCDLEIGHLITLIQSMPSRLLKTVFLLDIYRHEQIGAQNMNVTLRFVYRDDKKTISFQAAEVEHARIISEVQAKMKTLILESS